MYEPFLACGPAYETGPTTGSMASERRYRNYSSRCRDTWDRDRYPSTETARPLKEPHFVH